MSLLEQMHDRLIVKLGECSDILLEYGYDATLTLVARHDEGPDLSFMLTADDHAQIVNCVVGLRDCDVTTDSITPEEAALRVILRK